MASAPAPLFDRPLLNARLDRAWATAASGAPADFLLVRAAQELGERLGMVKRAFQACADVATPGPHAALALAALTGIESILRVAPTRASLGEGGFAGAVADGEDFALADGGYGLVVSLLALHHVNDLPGALIQMRRALRPDGLMMACLLGGDTLNELRRSLIQAEGEISHGASPRVAPFADLRALGGLLQRAGFALPVADVDRVVARYADMGALMRDLRAMGAANALCARSRKPLRRDVLARAGALYAERFSDPDGRIRATFDLAWISGWAPHGSQPKPLKPGSAAMRLADALTASPTANDARTAGTAGESAASAAAGPPVEF